MGNWDCHQCQRWADLPLNALSIAGIYGSIGLVDRGLWIAPGKSQKGFPVMLQNRLYILGQDRASGVRPISSFAESLVS